MRNLCIASSLIFVATFGLLGMRLLLTWVAYNRENINKKILCKVKVTHVQMVRFGATTAPRVQNSENKTHKANKIGFLMILRRTLSIFSFRRMFKKFQIKVNLNNYLKHFLKRFYIFDIVGNEKIAISAKKQSQLFGLRKKYISVAPAHLW